MSERPVLAVLVGAGLVGQVAHLQTLTDVDSPIRLAGVVDASLHRAQTLGHQHGVPAAASLESLNRAGIEAVVIAAPDPFHEDLVELALDLGLHVFVEKPLGLTPTQCDRMAAKATGSLRVCQVGYMKRFDPAPQLLLDDLRDRGSRITGIGVEIRDAGAAPFVVGFPFIPAGDDVPTELGLEGSRRFASAAAETLGRPATATEQAAYGSFTSSIIHDLNIIRFMLPGAITVESGFMAMDGVQVGMHLRTAAGVLVRIPHTQDTTIADYEERLTIYTTKGVYEMVFPAPYLLNETTKLRRIELKDEFEHSEVVSLNDSKEEAFVRELHAFARAIRDGRDAPYENAFSDGAEDLRLLGTAMRMAAGVHG